MVTNMKGGFKTLSVRLDGNCMAQHQLFYKEHSVRNQDAKYPKGRTLFVLNVPSWASSDSLKSAFVSICGPVKSVTLTWSRGGSCEAGFGKAYIVFQRESGLDQALALPANTTLTLHSKDEPRKVGLVEWCKAYNWRVMCDETTTKKEIDDYMHAYDDKVAKRLTEDLDEAEEGKDGWVTVTNKKKRGQYAPARKESTINKLQSKEERKSRKKELLNFYTFQIRESKKQNLIELRKKFELDKRKLQELKLKRTFKPF